MMNRIKQLRKSKHITMEQLASYVGVRKPTVSRWESEKIFPTLENWQALADFFEVSVPYLQGELTYDDLTLEGKKLEDRLGRTINDAINDAINDELKYSELPSEENRRAIKLALQSALEYYAKELWR